ncbi:MAG: cytochrome C oxidase Cbb3 [Planctomycetota bacterium]|nr:MAG: cytochrome C oxidase Cbb3 [Planctomycetota bacterium]
MAEANAAPTPDELLPDEPITDHDYDGIREFDNPSPLWLNFIFWGTVVFGIVYFLVYHVFHLAPSVAELYARAEKAYEEKAASAGQLAMDEPTLLRLMQDPEALKSGQAVFKTYCASCHGPEGQGLVGPNLTDDAYKNVRTLADIPHVIAEGAGGGAMPSWKKVLRPNDIVYVAAYVASLRGKNLTGPRGEEGQRIPPWPSADTGARDGEGGGAGS